MLLPSKEKVAGNAVVGPHVHQRGTGNLKGRTGEMQRMQGRGRQAEKNPISKGERQAGRRVTNMLERRSEGSRRSLRLRCHRNQGYLWAHPEWPGVGQCQAAPPLQAAALYPSTGRCLAPLASQWTHLQLEWQEKGHLSSSLRPSLEKPFGSLKPQYHNMALLCNKELFRECQS